MPLKIKKPKVLPTYARTLKMKHELHKRSDTNILSMLLNAPGIEKTRSIENLGTESSPMVAERDLGSKQNKLADILAENCHNMSMDSIGSQERESTFDEAPQVKTIQFLKRDGDSSPAANPYLNRSFEQKVKLHNRSITIDEPDISNRKRFNDI